MKNGQGRKETPDEMCETADEDLYSRYEMMGTKIRISRWALPERRLRSKDKERGYLLLVLAFIGSNLPTFYFILLNVPSVYTAPPVPSLRIRESPFPDRIWLRHRFHRENHNPGLE